MNIEKIKEMEAILDAHQERIDALDEILYEFETSQDDYERLKEYYFSEEFLSDLEETDAGNIPEVLKCGVLTEDAVFDLVGENFQLAIRMLELATKIIKKH